MSALELGPRNGPLHVLCLGAHSDDIEIGAAGTLLTLVTARPGSSVSASVSGSSSMLFVPAPTSTPSEVSSWRVSSQSIV